MAKKKSSVSSKNVHHMHLQHNFSGSAVAVVGGLLLVFALVLFVANNNFKKSGMSTEYYYDDSADPSYDSAAYASNLGSNFDNGDCSWDSILVKNDNYLIHPDGYIEKRIVCVDGGLYSTQNDWKGDEQITYRTSSINGWAVTSVNYWANKIWRKQGKSCAWPFSTSEVKSDSLLTGDPRLLCYNGEWYTTKSSNFPSHSQVDVIALPSRSSIGSWENMDSSFVSNVDLANQYISLDIKFSGGIGTYIFDTDFVLGFESDSIVGIHTDVLNKGVTITPAVLHKPSVNGNNNYLDHKFDIKSGGSTVAGYNGFTDISAGLTSGKSSDTVWNMATYPWKLGFKTYKITTTVDPYSQTYDRDRSNNIRTITFAGTKCTRYDGYLQLQYYDPDSGVIKNHYAWDACVQVLDVLLELSCERLSDGSISTIVECACEGYDPLEAEE